MTAFWKGMLAGYGIAIPVGAIAILIVETGLRRGFRPGFAAGAGAAAADTLYACLAAIGGSILSPLLSGIEDPLAIVGGIVLGALGARGLLRLRQKKTSGGPTAFEERGAGGTFRLFLGLTMLNPLTVVYFAALILAGYAGASQTMWTVVAFVSGAGLASLSWQTLLAGLGALGHRHLSPRLQTLLSVIGNLVVIGLGLRMLLPGIGEILG